MAIISASAIYIHTYSVMKTYMKIQTFTYTLILYMHTYTPAIHGHNISIHNLHTLLFSHENIHIHTNMQKNTNISIHTLFMHAYIHTSNLWSQSLHLEPVQCTHIHSHANIYIHAHFIHACIAHFIHAYMHTCSP